MCPACLATFAIVAAGAASTGGLAAWLYRKFRRKPALSRPGSKAVSREEWTKARKELLIREKAHTRERDEISRLRRELPWVKVEKDYVFEGPEGKVRLADLFKGKSQLIIYHFMFHPDWVAGCPSCSFLADGIDAAAVHIAHRDATLIAVSRAPYRKIDAFRRRMAWKFNWISSFESDFNYDFHVSFRPTEIAQGKANYNFETIDFPLEEGPGTSVFFKNERGEIFHTYSAYARGCDPQIMAYHYLDLLPKGRDEEGLNHSMAWVRHHDRYDQNYVVDAVSGYVEPKSDPFIPAGEQHESR